MNNKYYSGIGSRSTPSDILDLMFNYAVQLAKLGYTLRSGGADSADSAFEKGCDSVNGKKEIYLPWKNFNLNKSPLFTISKEALDMAAGVHPAWGYCSLAAKNLHARNCYQILSVDLQTPSDLVICWTKGGKLIGGTATAIKIAITNNIPVYNLFNKNDIKLLNEFIDGLN